MKLIFALIVMTTSASATPWDIEVNGKWEPNPACLSQQCHDTGIPDKPKPTFPKGVNSEPTPTTTYQAWGAGCGYLQGTDRIITHTAGGFDEASAKKQCAARILDRRAKGLMIPIYDTTGNLMRGWTVKGWRK